jgi:predicted RNA-binding protein YlqC (UPF0109 family)
MKALLEFIIKNIVGEDYLIEESDEEGKLIFTIKIPKDKIGFVIGKGGRIIKAIQDIIRIKATLENKFVYIKVEEK